ncbi:MAG: hypothetical protein RL414_158 [Actinomycetota bacterium]
MPTFGMTTFRKKSLQIFLALSLFGTTGSAFAIPSKQPDNGTKAPCRLEVEDPHISGSLLAATGKPYVKANVSSICDSPQSNVTITIRIFKKGRFADHLVAEQIYVSPAGKAPSLIIKVKNTFALCVTKEATRYETFAFSKAFIRGKWQYAREVKSHEMPTLPCGTKSLKPFL